MDVTNPIDIEKMISIVLDKFGKIDVLVNNAGICKYMNAEDMDYKDWLEVMNVNLNGVFLVSRFVGKQMIKQKKYLL
jgi:NAD(P)-dependent dehydrogenase (short-subunit alcohol dehydrogenase family)